LYRQLSLSNATTLYDFAEVMASPKEQFINLSSMALPLCALPFLLMAMCSILSQIYPAKFAAPSKFPRDGRTFMGLFALLAPLYVFLIYAGWELSDVNKVMFGFSSLIPIFWVNCLGGVDLWIEEPMGYPARAIAFTPTWIVSHGVYFLQWALEPNDFVNRLLFILYFCPQLIHLNYYFRTGCRKDWGTQLTILHSYFMWTHMTVVELYKFAVDVFNLGIAEITRQIVKDCPLHFTPMQFTVVLVWFTAIIFAPSARVRWALYSSLGPLNWTGMI